MAADRSAQRVAAAVECRAAVATTTLRIAVAVAPSPAQVFQRVGNPYAQRFAAHEVDCSSAPAPLLERGTWAVHRSATSDAASQASAPVAASILGMQGGSAPLPAATRAFFEPRFGTDFSHVRVLTRRRANETAKFISAKAFTVGADIAF